jgi:hypothetical protein
MLTSTASVSALPLPLQLWRLGAGNIVAALIASAAQLGIADHLASGHKSAEELARLTGTHAPSLYRALRALAGEGVFQEIEPGRFAQTPLSEFLRSDVPGSFRDMCIFTCDAAYWRSFGEIESSLRTGKPSLDNIAGKRFFEHVLSIPEGAAFHRAMTSFSEHHSFAIAAAYDFSNARRLCDIAGGHGHLLGTILESNSALAGLLFDAPAVIEQARSSPVKEVLRTRCEFVSGDFFESVPIGCDLYLMKWILHDWNDPEALRILSNVRRAIPENGRLLIADAVIAQDNLYSMNKLMDIIMLVDVGGLERTEEQFRDLLTSAGFGLSRVISTNCPLSIVEAVPV